ncbi:hypothetical protein [Rhodopirellula halodulae]|uniref:hypothetical protein n=1 Tax=Rhodopirellula halodulae TaxID=2894198 RepID=UPI001E5FD12C|nr:hypothetical protein [Rhodopirellula sp. JC737]MCC9657261.1 hypothetical protein [Rhodopirellula sp. JC737]
MNDTIITTDDWSNHLVWGAPEWLIPATILGVILTIAIAWSYFRSRGSVPLRLLAAGLKLLAVALMLLCLLQPMWRGERPRPQANLFPILVDTSQSMQLQDADAHQSRGDTFAQALADGSPWRTELERTFDVRLFGADSQLSRLSDMDSLDFSGQQSLLQTAIDTIVQRMDGRPVAGALLFSDGNLTDADSGRLQVQSPFPIYPVLSENRNSPTDLKLQSVSVTQSDFETSPMTVRADVMATGIANEDAVVQLLNAAGRVIQEQTIRLEEEGKQQSATFRFRPEQAGTQFYRVVTFTPAQRAAIRTRIDEDDVWLTAPTDDEATLRNNQQWIDVQPRRGPFRILYLAGRPNWDFKFLRRALQSDAETQLVGLLRIADKEPKFSFRDKGVNSSNPLFAGLGEDEEETREKYDEAVMIRLGVKESEELSQGFPETSEELYGYHGIILDDIEPEFFTQDQMLLLRQFVSLRGGGLLMLGGQESFDDDSFTTSPLGELSPVYGPRNRSDSPAAAGKWSITREGMLLPWQRLRETTAAEKIRLQQMPAFRIAHELGDIKPGAIELAQLQTASGQTGPAFVTQRFGKGRTAAMPIGDFWRWSMRRSEEQSTGQDNDDPAQAWRQIARWLVGEVPRRVQLSMEPVASNGSMQLRASVFDEDYLPMENATVTMNVIGEDGKPIALSARPNADELGIYDATFVSREAGRFRVSVEAKAADQSFIGQDEGGWVSDPGREETQTLTWNEDWLNQLATDTGGEVLRLSDLQAFVNDLPNREIPVTETWVYPLWHQTWVMLLAMACLCGEWGLRRWKGLA